MKKEFKSRYWQIYNGPPVTSEVYVLSYMDGDNPELGCIEILEQNIGLNTEITARLISKLYEIGLIDIDQIRFITEGFVNQKSIVKDTEIE